MERGRRSRGDFGDRRTKRKIGLCRQASSNDPSYTRFLVEAGIDSISVTPERKDGRSALEVPLEAIDTTQVLIRRESEAALSPSTFA